MSGVKKRALVDSGQPTATVEFCRPPRFEEKTHVATGCSVGRDIGRFMAKIPPACRNGQRDSVAGERDVRSGASRWAVPGIQFPPTP